MEPRKTIALLWAALIGLPMGGVAYLMDFSAVDAGLVTVLGSLGAAVFVLMFWRSLTPGSPPSKGV